MWQIDCWVYQVHNKLFLFTFSFKQVIENDTDIQEGMDERVSTDVLEMIRPTSGGCYAAERYPIALYPDFF